MVTVSLLAPPRINQTTNVVVSLLYTVSVIISIRGETWVYFSLGSIVEVVLLLTIAGVAWAWPRRPRQGRSLGSVWEHAAPGKSITEETY
jgi:hypothetical protein